MLTSSTGFANIFVPLEHFQMSRFNLIVFIGIFYDTPTQSYKSVWSGMKTINRFVNQNLKSVSWISSRISTSPSHSQLWLASLYLLYKSINTAWYCHHSVSLQDDVYTAMCSATFKPHIRVSYSVFCSMAYKTNCRDTIYSIPFHSVHHRLPV